MVHNSLVEFLKLSDELSTKGESQQILSKVIETHPILWLARNLSNFSFIGETGMRYRRKVWYSFLLCNIGWKFSKLTGCRLSQLNGRIICYLNNVFHQFYQNTLLTPCEPNNYEKTIIPTDLHTLETLIYKIKIYIEERSNHCNDIKNKMWRTELIGTVINLNNKLEQERLWDKKWKWNSFFLCIFSVISLYMLLLYTESSGVKAGVLLNEFSPVMTSLVVLSVLLRFVVHNLKYFELISSLVLACIVDLSLEYLIFYSVFLLILESSIRAAQRIEVLLKRRYIRFLLKRWNDHINTLQKILHGNVGVENRKKVERWSRKILECSLRLQKSGSPRSHSSIYLVSFLLLVLKYVHFVIEMVRG